MDGVQFIENLKKAQFQKPMILMSAEVGEDHLKKIANLNITGYVDKPCDPEMLKMMLFQALDGSLAEYRNKKLFELYECYFKFSKILNHKQLKEGSLLSELEKLITLVHQEQESKKP